MTTTMAMSVDGDAENNAKRTHYHCDLEERGHRVSPPPRPTIQGLRNRRRQSRNRNVTVARVPLSGAKDRALPRLRRMGESPPSPYTSCVFQLRVSHARIMRMVSQTNRLGKPKIAQRVFRAAPNGPRQ